jgi:hypothetical protein
MLDEFQFCMVCQDKVLMLITYIRELENAQIVAKQALEVINLANAKLTKEKEVMEANARKWKDQAEKRSQKDLDTKMARIRQQHDKFVNRGKIIS